jgi:hypothetical protein
MYQAPATVWNAIAASQPLTPAWAPLFRASPARMGHLLSILQTNLEKHLAVTDAKVIRSFLLVAPLLSESEAISAYLEEADRPDLRAALPELNSINEAVILASNEFRLSQSQQEQLSQALRVVLERPESVLPSDEPTTSPSSSAT